MGRRKGSSRILFCPAHVALLAGFSAGKEENLVSEAMQAGERDGGIGP